jgi:hypothetical protein
VNNERRPGASDERWLTPGVVSIGVASLGSDAGHELVTSLLPSFLSSTLHTGPAALGAIEGVSDALIGLSELVGGPLSNDPARRARIASGGYLVTAVATAAMGLSTAICVRCRSTCASSGTPACRARWRPRRFRARQRRHDPAHPARDRSAARRWAIADSGDERRHPAVRRPQRRSRRRGPGWRAGSVAATATAYWGSCNLSATWARQ